MTMMKRQAALLGLTTLAILFFSGAHAAKITFTNKCSYTVWPGTMTTDQKPQLSLTGFELETGSSQSVDTPSGNGLYKVSTLCKFSTVYFEIPDLLPASSSSSWSGRFFGRTNCSTDASGNFTCATADCGSGQVSCNGNGAVPPATLVEITIAENGGQDFYDVSLVDGFNLPISMDPQGGTGTCKISTCLVDVNAVCPPQLQVNGSDGSVIACKSPCFAFQEPKYCCTPPNNTPETCPPTEYSQLFKNQCPQAYSYAFDDKSSTFTCNARPDYVITFCP